MALKAKRVCAVVVNNLGQILPWTCESTMEQAEERANREFAGWENLKKLGARVVQAEIVIDEP